MRRQVMVISMTVAIAGGLVAEASAQDFVLQVGPPIAGNSQPSKKSFLVVRPGGCDPARTRITGTAEGLVDGSRRTVRLELEALATPGVHAVPREFAKGGVWVVNLVGTCAGKTAGALVPVGPNDTFNRETVKLLSHAATTAEIDASLRALTGGPK